MSLQEISVGSHYGTDIDRAGSGSGAAPALGPRDRFSRLTGIQEPTIHRIQATNFIAAASGLKPIVVSRVLAGMEQSLYQANHPLDRFEFLFAYDHLTTLQTEE